MKEHKCEYCGREFDSSRALSVHRSSKHEDNSKIEYKCQNCDREFYDYESRRESKDSNNHFCSVECKDSYERKGEYFKCDFCGNKTYKSKCHIDSMGNYDIENHFCSKECEKNWKRNNWIGENHPSWEGGEIEYGENWNKRRRMALNRDDNTCQLCAISQEKYYEMYSRELDVHHIVPIREFDDKEKANSLQNLVTLCILCHKKLEKHNPVTQEKVLSNERKRVSRHSRELVT